MAEAMMGLASVATRQGDFVAAAELYQEVFSILQRIQYRELIPPCLEGQATGVAEQGELVWAAQLWGAAEALREAIGIPIPPVYRLEYEQLVAKARAQLGDKAFARAWDEGRGMMPQRARTRPSSSG
jgi:hypothetical protein